MTRSAPPSPSAGRLLLEFIPLAMQSIRRDMRSQRAPDLSVPQFRALAFVRHHPGASLSDTAAHIGLGLPAMSALIDGLVRRGLLQRQTDALDRRRVTLALSRTGAEMLERARAAAQSFLDARFAVLSSAQRRTVARALLLLRPLFIEAGEDSPAGARPPAAAPPRRQRTAAATERSPR